MAISRKNKVFIWGLIIAFVIMISVMLNIGSKGTNYVANRSIHPLYSWKSGALQVRGKVIPDTCALATKNCVCNLSESMPICTFNFNFHDISDSISLQVKEGQSNASSIIFSRSRGCLESKENQIENCSIDFQWNKKEPGSKKVSIVMEGLNGSQSLVNLQINAK